MHDDIRVGCPQRATNSKPSLQTQFYFRKPSCILTTVSNTIFSTRGGVKPSHCHQVAAAFASNLTTYVSSASSTIKLPSGSNPRSRNKVQVLMELGCLINFVTNSRMFERSKFMTRLRPRTEYDHLIYFMRAQTEVASELKDFYIRLQKWQYALMISSQSKALETRELEILVSIEVNS